MRATVDVECDSAYHNHLVDAYTAGRVPRASLVAAAARVLKGRFQVSQIPSQIPSRAVASVTKQKEPAVPKES